MQTVIDYFKNLFFGDTLTVVAQCISLVATCTAISAAQFRTQKGIMCMLAISGFLLAVHFVILKAPAGFMLNLISGVRALIYSQRNEKKWAASVVWVYVFLGLILCTYPMAFLVFHKEPTTANLILEILPVLGMVATTFSCRMKEASKVRALGIISTPLWFTYNLLNHSVGGILTEAIGLLSTLIGILRLDIHRKPKEN